MHAQLSSGVRSVNFGFFMCVSIDGFDEIALLCRLNSAFNALQMRAHIVIWIILEVNIVGSIFTFLV